MGDSAQIITNSKKYFFSHGSKNKERMIKVQEYNCNRNKFIIDLSNYKSGEILISYN